MISDDTDRNAELVDDVEENLTASSERMLVIGFASIHLVNLLTATSR